MSGQRGQAAVELVAVAAVLAAVAVGAAGTLRVVRAADTAQRLAAQAAVLAAEGRPVPRGLRRRVRRQGPTITAELSVCALPAGLGCLPVRASATVP